ncbi:MAG: aquaporin [Bacteroidota bacterium]|nr:aquaporin [Bacteroidota bacterium]
MAYAIDGITGCHITPAISIAMLIAGKIKFRDAINYIVGQMIGATLAAGVLFVILKGAPGFEMGERALGSNG